MRDLNLWYRGWVRQRGIEHLILYETKTSSLFGMIVKPDSSDPGLSANPVPIDADHITIAKPPNRANQIYALIRDFIERRAERTVTREEIRIDAVKDDTLAIRDQQRQDSQKLSKLLAAVNWLRENSWNWLRQTFSRRLSSLLSQQAQQASLLTSGVCLTTFYMSRCLPEPNLMCWAGVAH